MSIQKKSRKASDFDKLAYMLYLLTEEVEQLAKRVEIIEKKLEIMNSKTYYK